jgi:hypothetical protein
VFEVVAEGGEKQMMKMMPVRARPRMKPPLLPLELGQRFLLALIHLSQLDSEVSENPAVVLQEWVDVS